MAHADKGLPEVGLEVVLKEDFEIFPTGIYPAGATGRVDEASEKVIGVKLDEHHPELDEWDNCLLMYGDNQYDQDTRDMTTEFWEKFEAVEPRPAP